MLSRAICGSLRRTRLRRNVSSPPIYCPTRPILLLVVHPHYCRLMPVGDTSHYHGSTRVGRRLRAKEWENESWLGGERRRGTRGEASADAGRRETTASRRLRAADAPPDGTRREAHSRRCRSEPSRDDDRGPARGTRPISGNERDGRRRARGRRSGRGVKAIRRLPNPRGVRRNARPPPCRRAPEIGRRCTTHE